MTETRLIDDGVTRLEVISDSVCPWCYIGAANLLRATAGRTPAPFALRWRPYQLNPDLPPEGVDRAEYLNAKFGGAEAVARIHERLGEAAAAAGLKIDFDAIRRSPNTLDAHRLIHWAEAEGVQTPVQMALFRRYFEAGEDISDPAVLRSVAEAAGMDGAVVARLLAGDADRDLVRAEADGARDMGVTGVPTFILGGRYVVTGAQPLETWTKIIDDIEAAAVAMEG